MTDLGLLFHGYSEENARTIAGSLGGKLGTQIHIFGAHDQDESTVQQILDGAAQGFGDGDPKIMMLLGFGNDQIQVVLKQFPTDVPRPIFCGLTEDNLFWTIGHLVEHLLEEQAYWREEARKKKEGQPSDAPGPGGEQEEPEEQEQGDETQGHRERADDGSKSEEQGKGGPANEDYTGGKT